MKVLRLAAPALAIALLSACGGGGGNSLLNPPFNGSGGAECQTGTSVELANPQPGAYAPGTSNVTIVANGNNNQLGQQYQNWYIYLVDANTGQSYQGSTLNLVADPNGPHPYPSDYYYSSNFGQTLPGGGNWNVYLSTTAGNCQSVPLQGFTT